MKDTSRFLALGAIVGTGILIFLIDFKFFRNSRLNNAILGNKSSFLIGKKDSAESKDAEISARLGSIERNIITIINKIGNLEKKIINGSEASSGKNEPKTYSFGFTDKKQDSKVPNELVTSKVQTDFRPLPTINHELVTKFPSVSSENSSKLKLYNPANGDDKLPKNGNDLVVVKTFDSFNAFKKFGDNLMNNVDTSNNEGVVSTKILSWNDIMKMEKDSPAIPSLASLKESKNDSAERSILKMNGEKIFNSADNDKKISKDNSLSKPQKFDDFKSSDKLDNLIGVKKSTVESSNGIQNIKERIGKMDALLNGSIMPSHSHDASDSLKISIGDKSSHSHSALDSIVLTPAKKAEELSNNSNSDLLGSKQTPKPFSLENFAQNMINKAKTSKELSPASEQKYESSLFESSANKVKILPYCESMNNPELSYQNKKCIYKDLEKFELNKREVKQKPEVIKSTLQGTLIDNIRLNNENSKTDSTVLSLKNEIGKLKEELQKMKDEKNQDLNKNEAKRSEEFKDKNITPSFTDSLLKLTNSTVLNKPDSIKMPSNNTHDDDTTESSSSSNLDATPAFNKSETGNNIKSNTLKVLEQPEAPTISDLTASK